jgi:flagellar protein FlaH
MAESVTSRDRIEKLLKEISELKGPIERTLMDVREILAAVDSLTALTIGLEDADLLGFFSRLREMRERDGLSFFVTVHTYSFTQDLLIRIRAMADTHLSLSIREVSGQLLKTLQVLKIRGASKSTGDVITFEVEPGFGIKVLPYTQVKV